MSKLTEVTDALSGEQVQYTYDALNRLIKAETVQNQTTYPGASWWGQSFGYDGYGNLNAKSPTSGHTATAMSLSVDAATNRISTAGFSYDANGNMTGMPGASGTVSLNYDVENRTGGMWFDHENQPLYRNGVWYEYGLHGERLATYSVSVGVYYFFVGGQIYAYTSPSIYQNSRNVYFVGRLIQSNGKTVVADQVGSVRANEDGEKFEYYPYGEEVTLHNPQDREKFGTYTRDSATGLDYADQRWYASVYGTFTGADRSTNDITRSDPSTLNGFRYSNADPVNQNDPSGLGFWSNAWAQSRISFQAAALTVQAEQGSVETVT